MIAFAYGVGQLGDARACRLAARAEDRRRRGGGAGGLGHGAAACARTGRASSIAVAAALLVLAVPSAPGSSAPSRSGGDRLAVLPARADAPRRNAGGRRGPPALAGAGARVAVRVLACSGLPLLAGGQRRATRSRCSTASIAPGALVFGGGHVVLPLLQQAVVPPGWIGRRRLPRRLWRGAGGARAAVHLRRLSRRGDGARAERLGRAALPARDLPAVLPAAARRPAVLGRLRHAPGAGGAQGSTPRSSACCWRRSTRRYGPAPSPAARFGLALALPAAGHLENPAVAGRDFWRARRGNPRTPLKETCRARILAPFCSMLYAPCGVLI